jgi:hypothetical protein
MASDPRFDAELFQAEQPQKPRSGWTTCLIGCLVVAVIGLVLLAAVAYWISVNFRDFASSFASDVVEQIINSSDLPEQEKQEVIVQLDRVIVAFREERLSYQQLGTITEKLAKSPLMTMIIATAVQNKYVDPSGLSEEEKVEAKQIIERFSRGAIDEKIDEASIDSVMQHVAVRDSNGQWELREKVTDEQLRAFLSAAKLEADEAGVPEETEPIDPSAELKKVVDEELGVEELGNEEPAGD